MHNRRLTLTFLPETARCRSSDCGASARRTPPRTASALPAAADALLQFAGSGETGTIESMTAGYRMQTDSSRRIRLTPTWKIDTETGEYLVDCDKKTIIGEEN
ncbi:MAG: hypothetical protein ACLRVN_02540 [Butyricicoccus sp.]